MARIRTIKPEFWSDTTISKMSIFTAFFYVALWNFADDAGRGRANAKELNGIVFSKRDDVENSQVEDALIELSDAGRIILYMDGDDRLFQICKWAEHQVINRPSKSKFPKPDGFSEPPLHINSDSVSIHGVFTEDSYNPQCWEDGRRKTEDGSGNRKTEDGRRKTEGGQGETTAPKPVELKQSPVRPSVFLEQAPSVPFVPELTHTQSASLPVHRTPEWQLSEADVKSLQKDKWTRQEIEWAVEIGIESGVTPRVARSVLHASILPDVREGKRPQRMTANAPPLMRTVPERPPLIDPVKMAEMESAAAERKRVRENALALNRPQGETHAAKA